MYRCSLLGSAQRHDTTLIQRNGKQKNWEFFFIFITLSLSCTESNLVILRMYHVCELEEGPSLFVLSCLHKINFYEFTVILLFWILGWVQNKRTASSFHLPQWWFTLLCILCGHDSVNDLGVFVLFLYFFMDYSHLLYCTKCLQTELLFSV